MRDSPTPSEEELARLCIKYIISIKIFSTKVQIGVLKKQQRDFDPAKDWTELRTETRQKFIKIENTKSEI